MKKKTKTIDQEIEAIKYITEKTKNRIDDEIYINIKNMLINYSEKKSYNITYKNNLNAFMEQYIKISKKLIEKSNNNHNIENINKFLNAYVKESINYKYYIYTEFNDLGIIEERKKQYTYTTNYFKKILQVISTTYKKENKTHPQEVYDRSKIKEIQNKSKKIIDKIINLNKKSKIVNQDEIIKPTNEILEIVTNLPELIVDNEGDFKKLIDCLYKLFWENKKRLEKYDTKKELSIINSIRNYYRHDIEHGTESEIKRKFKKIKEIYTEACGNPIPETAKEWQNIQEYLYDKVLGFLDGIEIKDETEM